jgi:hypothetical protein
MTRLLDLTELSHELKTPPERLRDLVNEARLPFAFSPGRGVLVDSRDVPAWKAAVERMP